jgi:hypothetical protein
MITPRPLLQPDPYDAYRLSQQEIGLEECRNYIGQDEDSWTYQPREADRLQTMWQLGAWLEPAVEGLCRQYPEGATLHDGFSENAVVSGLAAYEKWMQATPSIKDQYYLNFTPPSPHPVTHSILLGWPWPRDITIRTQEVGAEQSKGLFRLHNSYYEAINGSSYQAVRDVCADVLPVSDINNIVYSPFALSTRIDRAILGLLVHDRFGDFAADVYAEHDTAGLGMYRVWSTLGVLFDRLVKTT